MKDLYCISLVGFSIELSKLIQKMPLGTFLFHPILLLVSKAIFMTNGVSGWLCFNLILNLNVV